MPEGGFPRNGTAWPNWAPSARRRVDLPAGYSALLAHYRQESGWEQVQGIFSDDGAQVLIASVTIAEFARRMRELGQGEPDIHEALAEYRVFSEVIAVDDAIAWTAFQIGCRTSTRLPLMDALIAASAQARGERAWSTVTHTWRPSPRSLSSNCGCLIRFPDNCQPHCQGQELTFGRSWLEAL